MKTLTIFGIFFASLFVSQADAQQYFVYDGDTFNVMLTCSSDNSKVLGVSFSNADKSAWVKFELLDFGDFETTDSGGFRYKAKDGKGRIYWIDYFRTEDYTIVSSEDYSSSWTLYRRAE